MFNREHAQQALRTIAKYLLPDGKGLGIRTLDPGDWNYRPDYSQIETSDKLTSKGFNYHQGPVRARYSTFHSVAATLTSCFVCIACCCLRACLQEWVWVYGYYLRAKLIFDNPNDGNSLRRTFYDLRNHKAHIDASPMQGLPELTNKAGAECSDSCPTQAWSMSCCLDALYDAWMLDSSFDRAQQ